MVSLADAAAPAPSAAGAIALDVPYLPQTEALCGGAAAAMVFRYWGERHADIQRFAPLVDDRVHGIATGRLTGVIRDYGWNATASRGTIEGLRDRLRSGHPIVLLIEDRPKRFHYVVAVGADATHFLLHDPVWGPSRRISESELIEVWKPTDFWNLVILPGAADSRLAASEPPDSTVTHEAWSEGSPTSCDLLLGHAVDDITRRGPQVGDVVLGEVIRQCPDAPAPIAELAALRFAERRWADAAALAAEAVRRDGAYAYAWDVLGSSRFMKADTVGALAAWNHIGKPSVDSIAIGGLSRTRYSLIADTLGLSPNTLLTESGLRLAERRLQEMPARVASRIGYRPADDGFATVDVAVVERPARPSWIGIGAHAVVGREIQADVPGWSGQGEVWSANWRWWNERPRVAFSFAAPRAGWMNGVWRVDGAWSREAYSGGPTSEPLRESWLHGGIGLASWMSPDVRYEVMASLDTFDDVRRTAAVAGALERRLFADRLSLEAGMHAWMPIGSSESRFASRSTTMRSPESDRGFRSGHVAARFRSTNAATSFVYLADLSLQAVTRDAPLVLWPGAGDGHARPLLARAHPLLEHDLVAGPLFGRRVAALSLETERWFAGATPLRLGAAIFADLASASDRRTVAGGRPFQADVGAGLRLRLPSHDGTLRVDYGLGLRDGRQALTFGWQR
jgi:hypothetical protein